MTRIVRASLAAVVALLFGVLGAVSASAAPSPSPTPSPSVGQFGCLGATTTYGAQLPCQLQVQVLEPICDNNVPYLRYQVEAIGSPNTTVTITWINPTDPGQSVVYAGLPLSGRVLWPGAVVDAHGNPLGWPGWVQQPDGTWVQGGPFTWVRPSVQVLFKVNPEATVTVGYPPATPQCNANPPSSQVLADTSAVAPSDQVLAATGSNDVRPLAFGAAGLVLAGALAVTLVIVSRRRGRA